MKLLRDLDLAPRRIALAAMIGGVMLGGLLGAGIPTEMAAAPAPAWRTQSAVRAAPAAAWLPTASAPEDAMPRVTQADVAYAQSPDIFAEMRQAESATVRASRVSSNSDAPAPQFADAASAMSEPKQVSRYATLVEQEPMRPDEAEQVPTDSDEAAGG